MGDEGGKMADENVGGTACFEEEGHEEDSDTFALKRGRRRITAG